MASRERRAGIRAWSLALLAGLAACDASHDPLSPPAAGDPAPRVLRAAGPALVTAPDGKAALARGPTRPPLPESEGPASFVLQRATASPARAVPCAGAERTLAAAALARGLAVRITDRGGRGDLVVDDGRGSRTIDTDVLPELAVSPDGGRLLYARRTAEGHELVRAEPARGTRAVVYRGPTADRPVFRDDGHAWAFFGTGDGGFAALYVGAPGAAARALTNDGLRRTRDGLPPGFVPPPATREGLVFSAPDLDAPDGTVHWRTPGGRCAVDVATGRASCGEDER